MAIDYNEDGTVNLKDITAAAADMDKLQMFGFELMKALIYDKPENNPVIDFNKDGKINVLDIISFLQAITELKEFIAHLGVQFIYHPKEDDKDKVED